LTGLLDIEHPILSAPMAFAAGGKLAAAVTAADMAMPNGSNAS
jgi:NAD(P)H-dependent flavin oxidoreductase YrpB (nitropropane dioxygenase family)